jgi:acyl carrier protein
MNDIDERLLDCFQAVLPEVERANIPKVTMKSEAAWDSIATVTLISLIEETFGVDTQPEDIGQLTSFLAIRQYLERKASETSGPQA